MSISVNWSQSCMLIDVLPFLVYMLISVFYLGRSDVNLSQLISELYADRCAAFLSIHVDYRVVTSISVSWSKCSMLIGKLPIPVCWFSEIYMFLYHLMRCTCTYFYKASTRYNKVEVVQVCQKIHIWVEDKILHMLVYYILYATYTCL